MRHLPLLSEAAKSLLPGALYEHFKGNRYKLLYIARHSETLEELVVYQALYDGSIWVRPLQMFIEKVSVDGVLIPRFKHVHD